MSLFQRCLNYLSDAIVYTMSNNDIDENMNGFISLLDGKCSPLFKQNINSGIGQEDKIADTKHKWFDDECKDKQRSFYRYLYMYRKDKSDINRVNMCYARSIYKTVLRKTRFNFWKENTKKKLSLRHRNAKEYWKLLKNTYQTQYPKHVTPDIFARYFQAINNPEDRFFQADENILYFNERFFNQEISIMFAELDKTISNDEISKSIKQKR